MEEIYANVDSVKPVHQIPVTSNRGYGSSKKRLYFGVLIFLGLLNVFLLTGLISFGVHCSSAARLSDIKSNLTDLLQASNDQLTFMTEQRDLLKANLTEMSKEMIRLQSLSKQNTNSWSKVIKKKTCPAEWRMFSCSCYLLSANSGSWDQGRADCKSKGGDLVVIDNADEQRFLSTYTVKDTWIGLTDKETEGSWKWVDGTPLDPATTQYWSENQPDNGGGDPQWGEEDCTQIQTSHKWNDLSCSASLQWVCEKVPNYC